MTKIAPLLPFAVPCTLDGDEVVLAVAVGVAHVDQAGAEAAAGRRERRVDALDGVGARQAGRGRGERARRGDASTRTRAHAIAPTLACTDVPRSIRISSPRSRSRSRSSELYAK